MVDSLNLLVIKIKFIVTFKISVLPIMLNDVSPKSNVCVKTESVFYSNLYLMLPTVLRRVHLLLTIWGECRRKCSVDSISRPQLQKGLMES